MSSTISSGGPPIVEVAELTRAFGTRRALAGVTFSLGRGECLALFGPNGAGKTTLLRVLAGLLRPSSGSARVSGIQLPGGALARSAWGGFMGAAKAIAEAGRFDGFAGTPPNTELNAFFRDDLARRSS